VKPIPDSNTPWCRFGLIDFLMLIAACVAGFALAWGRDLGFKSELYDHPALPAINTIELIVYGATFGLLLLGPAILTVQTARGRRTFLSPGEWCWLLPLVIYSTLFLTRNALALLSVSAVFLYLSFYAHLAFPFLLSLGGSFVLARRLIDPRGSAPQWTDPFGASLGTFTGFLLWYDYAMLLWYDLAMFFVGSDH